MRHSSLTANRLPHCWGTGIKLGHITTLPVFTHPGVRPIRQRLIGRIVMRRLRQQQPPYHREQLAGRDIAEQRRRTTAAGPPATTAPPAEGELAVEQRDRQQLLRRGAAVLERDDLVENLCY